MNRGARVGYMPTLYGHVTVRLLEYSYGHFLHDVCHKQNAQKTHLQNCRITSAFHHGDALIEELCFGRHENIGPIFTIRYDSDGCLEGAGSEEWFITM